MVVPGAAVDVNHFTVLVHNESLRDTIIPVGTVIGQLCPADPVAPSPRIRAETVTPPTQLDPQLIQFGDSPIPQQWKDRLRQKLCERASVFSLHEWDVGLARDVEHHICLSDPRPFREHSRRLAPADVDDVRKHLQELLHAGIMIKESRSQYALPIVIARKKNGRIRMCIDYRTLNRRTTPDQYTTPRIDDALDCLSGRKPYVLHTDASFKGVGAVLYQEYPEGLRPVAFASRKLSSPEQRYPVHQLEFLALKWAVADKFHDYLYGAKFTVRTDNNPLTYVLTTAKLNATGHRWLAALATYDFDVKYRPGKANTDADLLSRNIADPVESGEWENMSPTALHLTSLEQFSKADLIEAQRKDDVLGTVIEAVKHGVWPRCRDMSPEIRLLRREAGRLVMRDGLLCRVGKNSNDKTLQLVLPGEFRGKRLQSASFTGEKKVISFTEMQQRSLMFLRLPCVVYSNNGKQS
ncbi:hypothetical protein L3Q82_000403 [Scortum barcoo]|uniref:Uncharacterized protein n=1 Tax=Scortum barcoo TaxID=214431 RepID=A0ACB8XA21_9TELE|nr:hypothetical protein L3Q82_000403 [Scortum barcoo]